MTKICVSHTRANRTICRF